MLRRFWTHLRFRVALHVRLATDIAFAIVGIVGVLFPDAVVLNVLGLACTAIGSVLLGSDLWELWKRGLATEVVENEDFNETVISAERPAGYDLDYGGLALAEPGRRSVMSMSESRPYITSESVNAALDRARNPLVIRPGMYAVPEKLQEHRKRSIAVHQPDFNDPKVRLRTDLTPALLDRGRGVEVQRTDYFSGVATNEMACQQFNRRTREAHRAELLFAVSDLIVAGGALIGLDESLLSNHIGVTTLILTADDQIVLQDQGRQMIGANETSVGASGSVDYADVTATGENGTLQDLLRRAMEREAVEELSAAFPPDAAGTVLTGFARYLARGGKPEFFGISRTTSAKSDLCPSRSERYVSGIRGVAFVPTAPGLIAAIDALIEQGQTRRRTYSLSMVACLRLARAHLQRAPESLF